MDLPEKAIREFQTIFEKRFHQAITFEQAQEKANQLLELIDMLVNAGPATKPTEDLEEEK